MNCDMCGKGTDEVYAALVEGTEMHLCNGCSKYGKVLRGIKQQPKKEKKPKIIVQKPEEPEIIQSIVEDYSLIIKRAREKMKLSQKDFAKMLSEKESLIHNLETGKMEPSIKTAQKLEKSLGVKLIEEIEERKGADSGRKGNPGGFTIGDMIKL